MVYRTFGDLKLQVEQETDTEGEEFIQEPEMRNYFNSAISLCEATIVKLGLKEKYLQTEMIFSTIAGQCDYALPSDIVINKIRKVVYRNQTNVYTLKPMESEYMYALEDSLARTKATGEFYSYALYKLGSLQMMRLIPTPRISVNDAVRIIYFKSLNRFDQDQTFCDVPDIAYEFLMSYVRYRIYAKESHVNTPDEKANMQALLTLMQDTMMDQVADPDQNAVEGDVSHYWEMN